MQNVGRGALRYLPLATFAIFLAAAPADGSELADQCCGDLEERVAELQAATARKGGHTISLTVSGYVAQEITWWDDGSERNVYLHGLGPTQATHVKFTGEAQIAPAGPQDIRFVSRTSTTIRLAVTPPPTRR
jgi:hypothetical protein